MARGLISWGGVIDGLKVKVFNIGFSAIESRRKYSQYYLHDILLEHENCRQFRQKNAT